MRRTSLPAISVQRPVSIQAIGHSGSSTVDSALLSEAHGIVTEMLHDPHLPPTVQSGLQALYQLLAPNVGRNSPAPKSPRPTPAPVNLSHDASGSGSDSEEIPYTGEKPSVQRKLCRRGVAAHLLRRMSTSTWTTTTSATGMPTLEPQPSSRRRATSFRGISDLTPGSSPSRTPKRFDTSSEDNRNLPPSPSSRDPRSTASHSPIRNCDTQLNRINLQGERVSRFQNLRNQHPPSEGSFATCNPPRKGDDISEEGSLSNSVDEDRQVRIPDSNSGTFNQNNLLSDSVAKDSTRAITIEETILRKAVGGSRFVTSDYESSGGSPSSTEAGEEGIRQRLRNLITKKQEDSITNEKEPLLNKRPINTEAKTSSVNITTINKTKTNGNLQDVPTDFSESNNILTTINGFVYNLEELSADPLLARISEWDYPIFTLAENSGKNCLSRLCYKVFSEIGLFETFRIPIKKFLNYFSSLETGYRNIPYHNSIHASDVLQCVYYFTSQPIPGFSPPPDSAFSGPEGGALSQLPCQNFSSQETYGILGAHLPALELMALYTAAAMHDFDHPGRTNAFLVTTNAPQAVLYNDRSVLENHHAAAAWSLFLSKPEFNFLTHLDRAEFKRFRYLIIEAILATDLKRHFEILAEFNAKANEVDAPGIDWKAETDRLLVLEMTIKLADINGPSKELILHRDWTYRIAEEFYEQGDEEEKLGLPISPYMDRKNPQLAKLQESFINHLVAPLCNAYGEAGLMPGRWIEETATDDDGSHREEEESDENSDSMDESDSLTSSSDSGPSIFKKKCRPRRILCLHTQHIQENYNYWVNKIKEEQNAFEDLSEGCPEKDSPNSLIESQKSFTGKEQPERPLSLNLSSTDQPMEPIEEERTPASLSSSHSFSFEKDETKL